MICPFFECIIELAVASSVLTIIVFFICCVQLARRKIALLVDIKILNRYRPRLESAFLEASAPNTSIQSHACPPVSSNENSIVPVGNGECTTCRTVRAVFCFRSRPDTTARAYLHHRGSQEAYLTTFALLLSPTRTRAFLVCFFT